MEIERISPLSLAFIGDAVHTLFVRYYLLTNAELTTPKLQHNKAVLFCKAKAQSEALVKLLPLLNAEEQDIIRRTRNKKIHSTPKNSSVEEYKKATCFEALLGYLFLTKQNDRLDMLIKKSMEKI